MKIIKSCSSFTLWQLVMNINCSVLALFILGATMYFTVLRSVLQRAGNLLICFQNELLIFCPKMSE